MRGDKKSLLRYFAIKVYRERYLERLYDQFSVVRNNPLLHVADLFARAKPYDKQRMITDFFLRVFGVVGILIYVGQNASLDNT
jgi:hypothetical protein